jgi:hypothetical protein
MKVSQHIDFLLLSVAVEYREHFAGALPVIEPEEG